MNERIKELAKQAGLIAGDYDDLDFKKNLTDKEKKFAELIVRECAALIPAQQSHAPDGRPLLKIFEEHFGVGS